MPDYTYVQKNTPNEKIATDLKVHSSLRRAGIYFPASAHVFAESVQRFEINTFSNSMLHKNVLRNAL